MQISIKYLALVQEVILARSRLFNLNDYLALIEDFLFVGGDDGAGSGVFTVGEASVFSSTFFHHYLVASVGISLYAGWSKRHSVLTWLYFFDRSDSHLFFSNHP